jgi:hypothetical protein
MASNLLDDFDPSAIATLGSHVASEAPDLIEKMGKFSSISALSAAPPQITTAFGPLFQARSLLTSIDTVRNMLDGVTAPDSTEITERLATINAAPAKVSAAISGSTSFFSDGEAKLAKATQASDICEMFKSFPLKALLGAVASDDLLEILKQ